VSICGQILNALDLYPFSPPQQLRIRKLTTNGTNHTNKLRTMLTISALFITIIHVLFRLPFVLFVRFVVEFGIAVFYLPPRNAS
jgi:hypothetical protein